MAETYTDPEGTVREVEPGFNGVKPNIGAGHARATYVDGKIVSFDYNTLPGTQGATAKFGPPADAYSNPKCIEAGLAGGVPGDSGTFRYAVGDDYSKPSGGKVADGPEQPVKGATAETKLAEIQKILNR